MSRSTTRAPSVAVLGGTFDHLHAGHLALLEAAFGQADVVKIGLTTDRFVRSERKPLAGRVQKYSLRRRRLRAFLRRKFGHRSWSIVPLDDAWGRAVRAGANVLVLSSETRRAAGPINLERRRRRLSPLRVYAIPLVAAYDGRPIASRRIRAGEIDAAGKPPRPGPLGLRRSRPTKP